MDVSHRMKVLPALKIEFHHRTVRMHVTTLADDQKDDLNGAPAELRATTIAIYGHQNVIFFM
jgi:hypothetical protein